MTSLKTRKRLLSKFAFSNSMGGEWLERRDLLSIAPGSLSSGSTEVIDEYGRALIGADWQIQVGMSASDVKEVIDNGTWRQVLNGDENAFFKQYREHWQSLGAQATQAWFDNALTEANLEALSVAHYDWFEDRAVPQAFPLARPLTASTLVGPIAGPLLLEDPIASPMSAPTHGQLEVTGGTALRGVDGSVVFKVTWNSDKGTPFSYKFRTEDGSAHANSETVLRDYTDTSGASEFHDGDEGTTQEIYVPINQFDASDYESPTHLAQVPPDKTLTLVVYDVEELDPMASDLAEGIPSGDNDTGTIKSSRTSPDPSQQPPRDPPKDDCDCGCSTTPPSGDGPTGPGGPGGGGGDGLNSPSNNSSNGGGPLGNDTPGDVGTASSIQSGLLPTNPISGAGGLRDKSYPTADNPDVSDRTGDLLFYQPLMVGSGVSSLLTYSSRNQLTGPVIGGPSGSSSAIISMDIRAPALPDGYAITKADAVVIFAGGNSQHLYFESATGVAAGQTIHFSLNSGVGLSGTYAWTMNVNFSGGPGDSKTASGVYQGVMSASDRSNSPYGNGWWLNGLDELIIQGDDVTYISSDGSAGLYAWDATHSRFTTPGGWPIALERVTGDAEVKYKATDRLGRTLRFNELGQLISVTEKDRKVTTYTYLDPPYDPILMATRPYIPDWDLAVDTITDPYGNTLHFEYENRLLPGTGTIYAPKLTSVTDSYGRTTHVNVDYLSQDFSLDSIVGPDDETEFTFEYDSSNNQLTKFTDDTGNETNYYYGNARRIDHVKLADNSTFYVSPYEVQGVPDTTGGVGESDTNRTAIVTSRSTDSTTTGVLGGSTTVTRDEAGQIISAEDGYGNITTYGRDEVGRIVTVTGADPDGPGELVEPVWVYTYDTSNNITQIEYPDHTTESWEYDSVFHRVTKHTDRMSRVTLYELESGTGLVTKMTQVVGELDDPLGIENTETDDLVTEWTYTTTSDPYGLPAGLVLTKKDPRGDITRLTYYTTSGSSFGKVHFVTFADTTGDQASIELEYDAHGNQSARIDEMGRRTEYEYDDLNRLTQTTSPDPDVSTPGAVTQSIYEDGQLVATIDGNNNRTEYRYDSRGRLWKTIPADPLTGDASTSVETVSLYDDAGHLASQEDELGRISRYYYNSLGQMYAEAQPDPDGNPLIDGPTTLYGYYPNGLLAQKTDPNGHVTHYYYDIMGRLIRTVLPDPDGPSGPLVSPELTYEYNDDGTLHLSTDGEGRKTQYEYDALGRLTKTIYPDASGEISEFSPYVELGYDKAGNVTSRRDENGHVTQYVYDHRDRQTEEILPDPATGTAGAGPTTITTYDDDGQIHTVLDPIGRLTTYIYDGAGRLSTQKVESTLGMYLITLTSMKYDDNGNVIERTDANSNVTKYVYDHRDRLTKTILPDPDDGVSDGPTTETTYDDAGQVTAVKDARGNTTSYLYDGAGRLKQVTLPDPDGPLGPQTATELFYTYDDNGNTQTATDGRGGITTYVYDALDRLISTSLPNRATGGASGGGTTHTEYNGANQVVHSTDVLNKTTDYEYDERGRLKKITLPAPDGGTDRPTIEYTYDDVGNVLTEKHAVNAAPTYATTTYEYDAINRRTTTIQPDPAGGAGPGPTTVTTYDDVGNVLSQEDAMGRVTTSVYDGLGRLSTVTQPDPDGPSNPLLASYVEYLYDAAGNQRFMIDGLAQITEYQYDHLNRLVKTIQPAATTGASQPETSYAYDENNNRISLTDPNDNTTYWDYDAQNRLITESVSWNAAERQYGYDKNNNQTSYTDRNGQTTRYTYDYHNNRTKEEWLNVSNPLTVDYTINWTFDDANRMLEVSDSPSSFDYEFGYDALGRLTSTEITLAGLSTVTLANQYDWLGNRTQLTASIGGTADFKNDYTYDPLSRLVDLTQQGQSGGNVVAEKYVHFAYNDAGQLSSLARYKNLAGTSLIGTGTYGYDDAGRLTSLNSAFANQSWTYDRANRVTSYANSYDGTLNYGYDHQNQVTSWSGYISSSQSYDVAGNRSDYTVEAGNQVTNADMLDYAYDAEGNETQKAEWHYQFDYRNRLTAALYVVDDEVLAGVHYEYDAFNRRISTWIDAFGTGGVDFLEQYIYDGDNVVLDFEDADGSATGSTTQLRNRYLYGPAVDQILAQENVAQSISAARRVDWFFSDNQNSTRDLVGNNGARVEHYTYDPFGLVKSLSDMSLTRYLYTGREFDQWTGLQYNRNRWYDPQLQRWISQDPIGFEGGDFNLYRYVCNGANRATDPDGTVEISLVFSEYTVPTPHANLPHRGARTTMRISQVGYELYFCSPSGTWRMKSGTAKITVQADSYYDNALKGAELAFSKVGEADHYHDIAIWGQAGGKQRLTQVDKYASELEFSSYDVALQTLKTYIVGQMKPALDYEVSQSAIYWDLSGRHTWGGANQRPFPSKGPGRPPR